jgi:hypothetical protein
MRMREHMCVIKTLFTLLKNNKRILLALNNSQNYTAKL